MKYLIKIFFFILILHNYSATIQNNTSSQRQPVSALKQTTPKKTVFQKIKNSRIAHTSAKIGRYSLLTGTFVVGYLALLLVDELTEHYFAPKKDESPRFFGKNYAQLPEEAHSLALATIWSAVTIAFGNWEPKNSFLNSLVVGGLAYSAINANYHAQAPCIQNSYHRTALATFVIHTIAMAALSRKHCTAPGRSIAIAAIIKAYPVIRETILDAYQKS